MRAAAADRWGALATMLGGILHPGGEHATRDLLARAGVGPGTRLIDIGCGAGRSIEIAGEMGGQALGIDLAPRDGSVCRGDLSSLPVADGAFDVVFSECALCLSSDLDRALSGCKRVLVPGGRLAFSDVVVERPIPSLDDVVGRFLCLATARPRADLLRAVERGGFTLTDTQDHHDELMAMRAGVRARFDVEGLARALDPSGRLAAGIGDLDRAVVAGDVGYVSAVASV